MNQKVLLGTGGSRGIGAEVSVRAAAQGYAVGVNYLSDAEAARAVVERIRTAGGEALALQGDVSSEAEVQAMFEALEARFGRVTHLVCSAGVTGPRSKLDEADAQTMRRVLETNVLGTLLCCQAAVRRMSTRFGGAGGSIVNLSSAAATLGSAGDYVWYAASKAAVEALTVGLARETAPEGMRVNAVAPGFIATDMSGPERLAQVVPTVPMQRAGTVEEVAAAVLFLLSSASGYTTGAVLRVAGGR